jgi:Ca2+-binding RTX toxin-like protein
MPADTDRPAANHADIGPAPRGGTRMVKLVAYKSVDSRDLTEIGLFQNIKKNLTRDGQGKKFDATKGDIDMHVQGKGMGFLLKNPVKGTMKSIDVSVGGEDRYMLKGLSIKLTKMKTYFKGNYEKKIFSGNDKLIGSSESDTLAGFNGKDTIKAGNGGDKLLGQNGADKLFGESGGDVLNGGKGKDFLDGGSGLNTLTGGKDADTFHFSTQLSEGFNNSSITDFEQGQDTIELVRSVFPDLTGKGALADNKFIKLSDYAGQDNVIVYDKATGDLKYALDSNNLIKFADVTPGLNLKAGDLFLV